MSYGRDLRSRVVKYVLNGGSKAEASRRYNVGLRTVFRWIEEGLDGAAKSPGRKKGQGDKLCRDALKKALDKTPDLMLKELAEMFGVSVSAVFYACKAEGLSRKKNGGVRGGETL